MLTIKPNCEHCDCDLPANSPQAMICSYECTFCRNCVENVLHNVCPNCGGGFCQRPSRPKTPHKQGASLQHQPASLQRVVKPVNIEAHNEFSAKIKTIDPYCR